MKIIRPNGTILEMTTQEYKEVFKISEKVARIESSTVKKQTKSSDMKEYMREYRKLKTSKHKHRKSSCLHWTKKEEQILSENSDKTLAKLRKLLPSRSKIAIKTRLYKIVLPKHKRGAVIRKTDGRIAMMKFIQKETKRIMAKNTTIRRHDAQKEAMHRYKVFKRFIKVKQ